MNNTNRYVGRSVGTTQRILIGLVAATVIVDSADTNKAAIKMAREEKHRKHVLAVEAKHRQEKVDILQPAKSKSHRHDHKGAQPKTYLRRY